MFPYPSPLFDCPGIVIPHDNLTMVGIIFLPQPLVCSYLPYPTIQDRHTCCSSHIAASLLKTWCHICICSCPSRTDTHVAAVIHCSISVMAFQDSHPSISSLSPWCLQHCS